MEQPGNLIKQLNDLTVPPPSPAAVLECLERHPYFSALAIAWLRRSAAEGMLYDEESRRRIALYAALSTPVLADRQLYVISDLLEGNETDENFYPAPEKMAAPDTGEAIDRFLNNYSNPTEADKETAVLEQLIFNPTADYGAVLAMEEEKSQPGENEAAPGTDDYLLNNFIIAARKEKEAATDTPHNEPSSIPVTDNVARRRLITPPPVPDNRPIAKATPSQEDTTFSESLAKIYIKRKNYSGAKEIISKLNLKYPEKSIYFAVQLRFLDKLLLNEQLKAKATASKQNI